jgi:tetratricopeptide (TPR) repeat protein
MFALLAFSFIINGCSKDPEVAKREYATSGDAYVAQKKYPEAVVEYRNAIQQDPRFGEARYKLAETYMKLNQGGEAVREYVRAADLLPHDAKAQIKAGQILLLRGEFLDAQTRAEKVLAQNPKSIEAQLLRAGALAGMKNLDEAVKQVESVIEENPTRSGTYVGLGSLQMVRGNQEAAEAAFKRAVEADPKSNDAKLALANFYWLNKRLPETQTVLEELLVLDPKNVQVNRALAAFYLASGRAAQAEQPLKTAAEVTKADAARVGLADYYLAMQRRPEAEAIYRAVAGGEGDAALVAKVRLAGLAVADGKRADGYALLDEALQKQPKHSMALLAKGDLLLQDRKTDEALVAAEAADPNMAAKHLLLGRIHAARFEYQQALTAYNEALRLSPHLIPAQLELARVHLAQGNRDSAVQLTQNVVKATPQNGEAQMLLARALMSKGDLASAEEPMRALIAGAPKSSSVLAQFGTFQVLKKNYAEARAAFERAVALNPDEVEALAGLAALDMQAGKPESARDRLERRLAINPKDPKLLMLAARVYSALRDWAAAERSLRYLIALDVTNLQAYGMLGAFYASQQRLDEARAEFEELAKRSPNTVGPPTLIGMIFQLQNKPDQARLWYEKALQIDQKAPVAANNLAWLSAESGGNLDVALQLAQTAKAQLSDRPEVDDTLGWIYYKKGLTTLAIGALQQSVEKDPKNPTYHYHLGLAYLKNGDKDKARQSLELALSLNPAFAGSSDAQKALASIKG